jgi:hypothetical protein
MKKIVILTVVLVVVAGITYKYAFSGKGDHNGEIPKQDALSMSKNTLEFNVSFERILSAYLDLKQGITDYDTLQANTAAHRLALASDSLKTEEIKGDSTGAIQNLAKNYAATIKGSAMGLVGEPDLTQKKHEFQLISDALYDLVRTVKYDRQKIYHQHCPMAFNDSEEAWWLSTSNQIENPYLGRKHPKYKGAMIECGDITDSLDFSKR